MKFYAEIKQGLDIGAKYVTGHSNNNGIERGATEWFVTTPAVVGDYVTIYGKAYILNDAGQEVLIQAVEVMKVSAVDTGNWATVVRDVTGKYEGGLRWPPLAPCVVTTSIPAQEPALHLANVDVTGSLRFSTALHGGFAGCSFSLSGRIGYTLTTLSERLKANVEIWDEIGRVVWEGSIVGTSVSNDSDTVAVSALGHYSDASSIYMDTIYSYLPPRSNLVVNPSFEGTGGWVVFTGHVGLDSYDTEHKKQFGTIGARSLKLTQPTAVVNNYDALGVATGVAVVPGKQYALSLYARGMGLAGGAPYVSVVKASDGTELLAPQSLFSLTDEFQRFEFPIVKIPTGVTSVNILIYVPHSDGQPAGSIGIDWVQFEEGTYPSPYLDGSFGVGYTWAGAAHGSISTRAENPVFAHEVLWDAIQAVPTWRKFRGALSDATYNIGDADFIGKRVNDAIAYTMAFGRKVGTEDQPVYFAIWGDRTPQLIVESAARLRQPDWFISLYSTPGNRVGLSISTDGIFNKVYSAYSSGSVTVPSEDFVSQQRYGFSEGTLQNGELPFQDVQAYDLQNAALTRYKTPRIVASIEIEGLVRRYTGTLESPHMIRAGDVLLFTDAPMFSSGIGNIPEAQELSAAVFVLGTEFDAATGVLRVDVGSTDQKFELIMSRLGISGGLS